MFRMFFVAYLAMPLMAAATSTCSCTSTASTTTCPCGQCEAGCGCCSGDNCTCKDCICESCGCDSASSLVSFTAVGETPSCCASGVCPSSAALTDTKRIRPILFWHLQTIRVFAKNAPQTATALTANVKTAAAQRAKKNNALLFWAQPFLG